VYKILDDNILLYSFTDIHPLVSENMLHAQKQTQPRYKLRFIHVTMICQQQTAIVHNTGD